MFNARMLLLLGTVALVGCREKWDVKNYAENIAEVTCAKAYDCCTVDDIVAAEQDSYGKSRSDCEDKTADVLNFKEDKIERGIDKSRLVYHGAHLQRCLANYAKLTCEELKTTSRAAGCETVLVPLVPEGERCELDEECLSGSCQRANDDDEEGTCRAFATDGDVCADLLCAPGTYCADTCVPTHADGESCRNNFECASGGCNGADSNTNTAGSCGPMGGTGGTCYLTKGCSAAEPSAFAALGMLVWVLRRRSLRRTG